MTKAELQAKVAKLEQRIAQLEGTKTTYVGVVQDRSGSMGGREEATISGFNEYLATLRCDAADLKFRLSLVQFDHEIIKRCENEPLANVRKLNSDTYVVRGSTALYDAIGQTVHMVENQMGSNDAALILIMTDGYENASKEFTRDGIRNLIKSKEKKGNWTFVYMGADQDAFLAGTNLGFAGGNTYSYLNTAQGISDTFSRVAVGTHSHAAAGGLTSSTFSTEYLSDQLSPNVDVSGTAGTPGAQGTICPTGPTGPVEPEVHTPWIQDPWIPDPSEEEYIKRYLENKDGDKDDNE